jgi:glutaredoxin
MRVRATLLVVAMAFVVIGAADARKKRRKKRDTGVLSSMDVVIYTHPACHYCTDAKAALKEAGIVYTEKTLEGTGEGPIWTEMQHRAMSECKQKVLSTEENGMKGPEKLLTIMPQVFAGTGPDAWYHRPGVRRNGDIAHMTNWILKRQRTNVINEL